MAARQPTAERRCFMYRRSGTISGLLAVTLLIPVAGRADAAPAAVPTVTRGHGADRAALQRALDAVVTEGVPGAIAEVRDESGVWRGASGVADLADGRRARAADRFRAGSVTKTFVATVVLQLVAQGEVGLDDAIGNYLPGLVPDGTDDSHVTVRQLLDHTSGLPNYTDVLRKRPDPIRALQYSTYTPHELVGIAVKEPRPFNPGKSWAYSNTNYVVLGLLIERVTGNTLGHEITRRIVRPLQLNGTSVPTSPHLSGPHLKGYERLDGATATPTDLTDFSATAFWGPGNMISTTSDLNRFYSALTGGKLLAPHLLREMRDMKPTDRAGRSYGLGLEANANFCGERERPAWGHSGSVPGYNTFGFTSSDGKRQITLSMNTDLTKTEKADAAAVRVLSSALCSKNS
ncbi:serine hydrolase domain-containing protein [Streptomyces platensis]|uniref:serine hydrolase domain-containing protein n=1 Tax=Streptomyces platensis TaxID=58346 RepID=UPI001F21F86C|nr:serine hydrolase domain-containing protein [Streptomyces platensis]MCF3148384.1 beta-lactamase family protein [Streptomyces platensis]